MKLPLLIVSFLPKKLQDKCIQHRWDKKTNKDILVAFKDATEWIELSNGIMSSPTLKKIAGDCQDRLAKFILPQMIKRGL